ncbi:MAG TPA: phage holin family protein [Caulobacteraceae bacterium]|jgi:putative membrane protein|nr:phage holin family protein [Caulobacteraceae bacterium]
MARFIVQALAAAFGFWAASRIVPGVHARNVASLIAAGVILGLVNALVRPILIVLTIPLTLLTLGLFLFVVNGITVWITAAFLKGVDVNGLWPAILASVVITVISWAARAVLDVR